MEVVIKSELSSERSATPMEEPFVADPEAAETPAIHFGSQEHFFFLSNAFPSRITFGNHEFANAEAVFQAAKFREHPKLQQAMIEMKWPVDLVDRAQHWTRYVPEDWEEQCLAVMKEVQTLKYVQNDQLRARLLQTGDTELIYTSKDDKYFGRDQDGQGQNHLGQILMELRYRFNTLLETVCLSRCFKLSADRQQSRSAVWHTNNTSEQWYLPGDKRLQEVTVQPAIEDAPASEPAFLHNIVHGHEPWTLYILFQVRGRVTDDDNLWVNFSRDEGRRIRGEGYVSDSGRFSKESPLSSENLKATAKGDAEISIYGIHVDLPASDGDIKIHISSKSAEYPEQPNYTLSVKTAAAE
ncbi:unnamed protein product [Tilletia laevis]|nr:unnamed protein product [Tilletia laevis]CAD7066575.1 unnamed protein product [Tilletia caries]